MERRAFLKSMMGLGVGLGAGAIMGGDAWSGPTSRPASGPSSLPSTQGLLLQDDLASLMQVDPRSVRFRIGLVTDPHFALRDQSLDFKALRFAPWIVGHHLQTMRYLGRLTGRKVDLLLLPGDLTRDSEPWNHAHMLKVLKSMPFPSMVVPGNHDVRKTWLPKENWGVPEFVAAYRGRFGGYDTNLPYYAHEVAPGIVVVGLNSSDTPDGALRNTWNGRVDDAQVAWLKKTLQRYAGKKLVFLMVHHTLIPHHPAEREDSKHLWKNFHTDNADAILKLMADYQVPFVLTGHHHIQRVQKHPSLPITEIVTSGACSYPSQVRVLDIDATGRILQVYSLGLPWPHLIARIAHAAKADSFWYPPDKPQDPQALIDFLHGKPEDRRARLALPKVRELR
ncbi:MAG: metallophosphoesterase [Myxococcales bacterium]|nr:metallophosphoesterase [Myxococcales bacterium]